MPEQPAPRPPTDWLLGTPDKPVPHSHPVLPGLHWLFFWAFLLTGAITATASEPKSGKTVLQLPPLLTRAPST